MKRLLALLVMGITTIGISRANTMPSGYHPAGRETVNWSAATATNSAVAQSKPTTHQIHKVIRLTKKQIPIARYFADDDDDSNDISLQQPMLFRRQTAIKARIDIAPSPDDYAISDEIKLRLMLARIKALDKFNQIHGA